MPTRAHRLSFLLDQFSGSRPGVHRTLTAKGTGTVATARQTATRLGYQHSQVLRYAEEALAEDIATRSLLHELRCPLSVDYNITGNILVEGVLELTQAGMMSAAYTLCTELFGTSKDVDGGCDQMWSPYEDDFSLQVYSVIQNDVTVVERRRHPYSQA